ncbi:MAG: hypothetical protein QOI80_1304 [Solirubrobacteraceae bacterium]|jgi:hypothetical protein|nr:hypothetical protein [Solirubrobacteraceae bacterium]
MRQQPHLLRGEWMYSAPGYHSYPPPRPRFPGPRQVCPHCELPSQTSAKECPVCGARFRPTWLRRLLRRG